MPDNSEIRLDVPEYLRQRIAEIREGQQKFQKANGAFYSPSSHQYWIEGCEDVIHELEVLLKYLEGDVTAVIQQVRRTKKYGNQS